MLFKQFTYPGSREAFEDHFRRLLAPDFTGSYFRGTIAGEDDIVLVVDTPKATDLNLGIVDFTPTRWKVFIDHYIDHESFNYFLGKLPVLRRSQEIGYTTHVKAAHSLGNCLMGLTARSRSGHLNELTLISRTTIWAPTGILDLYLGSLVAEWWQGKTGIPVKLRWFLSQLQVTTWKSLPFLINLAYREATERGINIHDTSWMYDIAGPASSEPTKNRFLSMMRGVYHEARNPEIFAHRTYRTPRRQTFRMQSAERRFLEGCPRFLQPGMETILDPSKMGVLLESAALDDELQDGEDDEGS